MKKFSYVCEFFRKDPENPNKAISLERHLFVFVIGNRKEPPAGRAITWWDPMFSDQEGPQNNYEI